jgi:hypothetical protein
MGLLLHLPLPPRLILLYLLLPLLLQILLLRGASRWLMMLLLQAPWAPLLLLLDSWQQLQRILTQTRSFSGLGMRMVGIFSVLCPVMHKSNASVSIYPSCSHEAIKVINPVQSLENPTCLAALTMPSIILPKTLHAIIARMS